MRVLFFGDSICVGEYVSPHLIWTTQIAARLEEAFPRSDVLVINSSLNGNTTRQALERMAFDVQRYAPDMLIVQFGINDCHFWDSDKGVPRVQKLTFEANLHEIIVRGRNFGARKVILHTNHPTSKHIAFLNVNHGPGNAAYNEIIRRVASTDGRVELLDLEKVFQVRVEAGEALDKLLMPDGIHLSLAGHQLYYENVCPVVERSVRELLKETERQA